MEDMLTRDYDGCDRRLVGVRRLSRKTDKTFSPADLGLPCGSQTWRSIRNAWAPCGKIPAGAGRTWMVRVSSRPNTSRDRGVKIEWMPCLRAPAREAADRGAAGVARRVPGREEPAVPAFRAARLEQALRLGAGQGIFRRGRGAGRRRDLQGLVDVDTVTQIRPVAVHLGGVQAPHEREDLRLKSWPGRSTG